MLEGYKAPEKPASDKESEEVIEISPDGARDAINQRMQDVFGTDGNEAIDHEHPVRVVE